MRLILRTMLLLAALMPAVPAHAQELMLVPAPDGTLMRTTVYRPAGRGPHRLAVLNHASLQNAARRAQLAQPRFEAAAAWFTARGYLVVVPQRPGHGETGGPYLEDQGGCDDADYQRAGLGAAASIEAAIRHMTVQPGVRRDGVVVVGHSAGGWGAIALASRNPSGVSAVISFAGGRGGRSFDRANVNCAPDRLVEAAAVFGKTARIPSLWIYAENDTHFGPELARRMADAYRASRARLEFRVLPRFNGEGHTLFENDEGVARWGPIAERFLANLK
jgi:dienelactone hydrolase